MFLCPNIYGPNSLYSLKIIMNLQWNGLQNDFSEIRGSINLKQQLLSNKFKRKYILSNLHSINRKLIIYSIYICYIISNIYYRESNHSSNNINYIIYRFKLLDIKFQIFYAFFFFFTFGPQCMFSETFHILKMPANTISNGLE